MVVQAAGTGPGSDDDPLTAVAGLPYRVEAACVARGLRDDVHDDEPESAARAWAANPPPGLPAGRRDENLPNVGSAPPRW